MNHRTLALCVSVLLGTGTALADGVRTWTDVNGNKIEAEFVEQKLDQVVLRDSTGKEITVRMGQLSAADQLHIGSQQRASARGAPQSSAGAADVPPALKELFGTKLVNAKGQSVSPAELEGKKIGIYFSAQWCPPCRGFTPTLVDTYNQLQKDGKPFDLVFVSHDRSEKDMYQYMRDYKMPWKAIRFDDPQRDALKKKYGIQGIPTLVIVDSSGKTLSSNARGDVTKDGVGAFDKW